MIIAARLKKFFASHQVPYEVLHHPRMSTLEGAAVFHKCSLHQILSSRVLQDDKGLVLVVHPLDRPLNLANLRAMTGRDLEFVSAKASDRLFDDCEPGQPPAFGEPYGIVTYMDRVVLKQPILFCRSGSSHALMRIESNYLMRLNSRRMLRFYGSEKSSPAMKSMVASSVLARPVPDCHVKRFYSIPLLPERFKSWLDAPGRPLDLVEVDEALSVSPQLSSMRQSLLKNGESQRFSAFSMMVLSVQASTRFSSPEEGILGARSLRMEAILTAMLVESLGLGLKSVDAERLQLAALFHNFGFLLMAHLFAPEFMMLNKLIAVHPEHSIESLEARIVGLGSAHHLVGQGHAHMGAWLMRHWGMPEGVAEIVDNHHNKAYQGIYIKEVKSLLLIGMLLRQQGIGDGLVGAELMQQLHVDLQLEPVSVQKALQEVLASYKAALIEPSYSLQSEG